MDNSTNGYNVIIQLVQLLSGLSISSSGQYQVVTIYGPIGSGGIYSSNDYGVSWSTTALSTTLLYQVSISASGQYQTAVQSPGSIYTSNNFGASWSQYSNSNFPTSNYYSGVSVSASGKYQSVIFNYSNLNTGIGISSDYGANWVITGVVWATSVSNHMGIAISATGQFQTVVSPGGFYFINSNYGTGTWTQLSIAIVNAKWSVSMSASGQYQSACVVGGYIYTSSNYGVTWTQNTSASSGEWMSVAVSSSGQYQVACSSVSASYIYIYLSMDYGNTWTNTLSNQSYINGYQSTIAISSSGQYITCAGTYDAGSYYGFYITREILMPAKTFIIDHPRDSSKHLIHACIEGPEAGVYYRGRGEITNSESTEIILPEYVESLSRDFTIEITHIYDGTPPKSYSVSEILYNRFMVYGENGSFYWQVTGARSNIIVEPYKNETNVRGNTDGPYLWIE